jgi:uncharacterized membrane protein (DUF106 family)
VSDDYNKQILDELKKMNEKLEELSNKQSGLSTPMKFIALVVGFMVLGPLFAFLYNFVIRLLN